MDAVILAGLGGAIGSVFRFGLSKIRTIRGIPTGTLLVNLIGSFVLAVITFSHISGDWMNFVGSGCLGGFTTFSTFSYETFRMLENQDYYTMGINILGNAGGCLLGVYAGYLLVAP
ncbi:MAG: CrcB family protein [Methanoregula sp.]|jgi:CrcB protein